MNENTSPHDYFNKEYVLDWAARADAKRSFRIQFFDAFASELSNLSSPRALEIGSGPGFLAEHVLNRCVIESYHLFDFSPHMLELSRERLAAFGGKVRQHQGNFLEEGWWTALSAPFDVVISMQSIHETQDAARIPGLYREIGGLLKSDGLILVADLVNSETKNESHFLTLSEHQAALRNVGFDSFRQILEVGELAMFGARWRGKNDGDK